MQQRTIKTKPKFAESSKENLRWTLEEKRQLLTALRKHGHLDIAKIQSEIPQRSHGSIRSAIQQWKKEARTLLKQYKWASRKLEDAELLKEFRSPMLRNTDNWVSLLSTTLEDKPNILYGLCNLFLTIAETEVFPSPELCEEVDFREVYSCMHSIANGYPCKNVSIKTSAYMFDCFIKMQIDSNKIGHERGKTFLKQTYGCVTPLKTYPAKKYKSNKELQRSQEKKVVLKKVIEIPDTNPLGVPTDMLTK